MMNHTFKTEKVSYFHWYHIGGSPGLVLGLNREATEE